MTSGDIIQVAEVVRDLSHAQMNKGISPALKRMLAKARVTLASEVAARAQKRRLQSRGFHILLPPNIILFIVTGTFWIVAGEGVQAPQKR